MKIDVTDVSPVKNGDDEFTPWVMPRELWAGEKVLLRSSEDRITALKLS